jgi:serine protease
LRRILRALGLLAFLAASAPPADAAADAAATCQAAMLRAMGRMLDAELGCWATQRKNPDADPGATGVAACRAAAESVFRTAYTDALFVDPDACTLIAPAGEVIEDLALEVDGLVDAISGDFDGAEKAERTLHASLLNATGDAFAGAFGAESKDATKGDEPKRLSARSKARSKLLSSFDKALLKAAGVPYTGLGGTATADEVDRIADEFAAATAPASYAMAGTIRVADGSFVDSDVNDPNSPPVSNDGFASAQLLPVPAAVGGYVNLAGRGPAGNSRQSGDPSDFFQVSLAAGQRVSLRFADPQQADLDLCLYDGAQLLLDCSTGIAETEELLAPASGEFFVEVFAFEGCACGSSYVLTIGQALASAGDTGVRLSDEFVPGELIVSLAATAALRSGPAPAAAYEPSLGLEAVGGATDREMLFRLPASGAARAAALATLAAPAPPARFARLSAAQREKLDTLLALKALRARADVASVEPNRLRHAQLEPNDEFYGLQWHYPLINLPAAWDLTTGSASVEVAVIDSGVLFGHPDLAGQLSSAFDFDFVSDPSRSLDGGGIDAVAEDPGDGGGIQPSSFHGSHVAGTIGARTDDGTGVAGVSWDVTIVPVRALGLFGSGTSYDVLQAVRYAAGLANDSGTSHAVDVINLSLGSTGFSNAEQLVYDQVRAAGVIVVAAAGNNDSSQPFYPASYDGVVSVSAVETRRQKAPYSNFGPNVDVAAPGGDTSADRNGDGYADGVLSTVADELAGRFAFAFYQGTSMASPHVAGVAALMKAVNPSLQPDAFDTLLSSGQLTTDLGAAGRDDVFGHGLIDARAAVEAAGASAPTDPILLVSPTSLNLGTTLTQASFQLRNGGAGSLTIDSVTDDQLWLSVTGSGLGTYQVTVNRAGLADGTYTGTVSITSSAGAASVSVVMAVLSGAPSPDAGFHYVLVIDPDTFETVAQFDVTADGGEYEYALESVPGGSYLLYAGSDTDNDLFICGTGEACGAYPTLGTPDLVPLTGDRTDLDFVSGFLQTLGTLSAGDGTAPRALRRLDRRLGLR